MSVYAEILQWSVDRPLWQRDALRRLVCGAALTDQDITELSLLCLSEAGVPSEKPVPAPDPLAAKHVPVTGGDVQPVGLKAIHSVQHVNLLDPNSNLMFGEFGLTLIYGDNGSGKSGYTRILRKICRARDAGGPIAPNVFEEPPAEPASATVEYLVGKDAHLVNWVDGEAIETPLSQVCIFDSECAEWYVTKDNDVAYRPFGLDLFDRLSQVCDSVSGALQTLIDESQPMSLEPPPELLDVEPVRSLWPLTSGTDLTKLQIGDGAAEEGEMQGLRASVVDKNPARAAARLEAAKASLVKAKSYIDNCLEVCSPETIGEIAGTILDLGNARLAVELLQQRAFENTLPGTGSDAWRLMWESARNYSSGHAYVGYEFPRVDGASSCVLCQQPLANEAKERLRAFEDFVSGDLNVKAQLLLAKLAQHKSVVSAAQSTSPDEEAIASLLSAHAPALVQPWKDFVNSVEGCTAVILSNIENQAIDQETPAVHFDVAQLEALITTLNAEGIALAGEADAEGIKVSSERYGTLLARKWVRQNYAALEREINRLKYVAAIKKAMKLTVTTAISRKSTELTDKYISEDLQRRIKDELAQINVNSLKITITRRSIKGVAFHKVDLDGRKVHVPIKGVVSEGEFRGVALAAFLAELGQATDESAIVLDDPVSSMDHLHRRKVAERLIVEGLRRQLVVFTHDIVFMNDLLIAAEQADLATHVCQVVRQSEAVGTVSDGPPWQGMTVTKRIGALRSELVGIKKLEGRNSEVYELRAKDWYGRLRETWERLVEELMLNSVVLRFSREVQTQRLSRVIDLEERDFDLVFAAMKKCSSWIRGHDQPLAVNEPVPPTSDLEADLAAIDEYASELLRRKRSVRSH